MRSFAARRPRRRLRPIPASGRDGPSLPAGGGCSGLRTAVSRDGRSCGSAGGYRIRAAEGRIPPFPPPDTDSVPRDVKAVWIRGDYIQTEQATGTKRAEISEYYTPSPFVDQVNGANDAYEADEKGSTIVSKDSCASPARTASRCCRRASRFGVAPMSGPGSVIRFVSLTPSSAYDRYMRSRYKQQLNSEWGAEENPFIEQITVYSNISNGLGIFAGYNYTQTSEL
ncbi:MAG: hypothetical protein ACLTZY_14155 [Alistipes indistinctus]